MRYILIAFLLSSCGVEKKEILLNPQPKTLEIGESAEFSLDPSESSKFVTGGDMRVVLESMTDAEAIFKASANVDTKFGPQKTEINQGVSPDILNLGFLVDLRETKTYQAQDFKIDHLGFTDQACDKLKIYDMEKYKGVVVSPVICVASRQVPVVQVDVDMYGIPVKLIFKQRY